MLLLSVLKTITKHPLNSNNKMSAAMRFIKWQLACRLNPYPVIYQFTSKSKLILKQGLTGATGNLYCGLFEFNDMAFVLHFLRKDDQFVDVGANIGSYTVLGSAHLEANTLAFEPLPSTYEYLKENIAVNQIGHKVKVFNLALGSAPGELDFTSTAGAANHVAIPNEKNTVKVKVKTLDEVMKQELPPVLIKIDVEGFETEVIAGATDTINNPAVQAIVIELKGLGSRYGYDEALLHNKLVAASFKPYQYDAFKRKLILLDSYLGAENTIYVRDIDFVNKRIAEAEPVKILNYTF